VKTLAMIVGAAILFTTAHVSILATGGYGSSHAYISLGVAAGVAVASIARYCASRGFRPLPGSHAGQGGCRRGRCPTTAWSSLARMSAMSRRAAPLPDWSDLTAPAAAACNLQRSRVRRSWSSAWHGERSGRPLQPSWSSRSRQARNARTDLAAFKAPPSPSPFADRIGWTAWVLDLVMAGLGSIEARFVSVRARVGPA